MYQSHFRFVQTCILGRQAKWNSLAKGSDDIPPFRAFITGPDVTSSGTSEMNSSFDDDTNGINSIRTTDIDGTERWYDLQGHRINKPMRKGLYIKNGKKISSSPY